MPSDEKIIKLLEEIRDFQKGSTDRYNQYLQKSEEQQKKYYRQMKILLGAFLLIGLILILF
jgi:hypothetical protein